MKLLFKIKKVTTFFVVSIFILTHICLLFSVIAECGINSLEELDEAEKELDRLKTV